MSFYITTHNVFYLASLILCIFWAVLTVNERSNHGDRQRRSQEFANGGSGGGQKRLSGGRKTPAGFRGRARGGLEAKPDTHAEYSTEQSQQIVTNRVLFRVRLYFEKKFRL